MASYKDISYKDIINVGWDVYYLGPMVGPMVVTKGGVHPAATSSGDGISDSELSIIAAGIAASSMISPNEFTTEHDDTNSDNEDGTSATNEDSTSATSEDGTSTKDGTSNEDDTSVTSVNNKRDTAKIQAKKDANKNAEKYNNSNITTISTETNFAIPEYRIKTREAFLKNYGENPETERLLRTYFQFETFMSYELDTKSGLYNNIFVLHKDIEPLITILQKRKLKLEKYVAAYHKKYGTTIAIIVLQKISSTLSTLIESIRPHPNQITSLSQKEILKILTYMAWYLLNKERVPNEIASSWSDVVKTVENEDVDKLITAISEVSTPNKSITDGNVSINKLPEVKKRLTDLLRIMEGIQQINDINNVTKSTPEEESTPEEKSNPEEKPQVGGGNEITIPPFFLTNVMNPIHDMIDHMYPVHSFIKEITLQPSHDLVIHLHKLLRICATIEQEQHYGFYRITNVPSSVRAYIEHHCTTMMEQSAFGEIPHTPRYPYQYFLFMNVNLFYKRHEYTTKLERKEYKAVRSFFTDDTLYLLHTTKKKVDMSYYLHDPYYAYDIQYDAIDDVMEIQEIDQLDSIDLGRYLRVLPSALMDTTQLELSVFHQLHHLSIQ